YPRTVRAGRRRLVGREAVGLVTNAGLAKLHRRRSIRRQLYESADRVVRVTHREAGVRIDRLDTGMSDWYAAVPPNQMTLDDFDHTVPRILVLESDGGWHGIKAAGHLRFGW